jgi:hypothetical protein
VTNINSNCPPHHSKSEQEKLSESSQRVGTKPYRHVSLCSPTFADEEKT